MGCWEMEFKGGYDYVNKICIVENCCFDVSICVFVDMFILQGNVYLDIFIDDVLDLVSYISINLLCDIMIVGDDYIVVQLIDVYYFEVDLFFDNIWCVSGGVCYEDFCQVVVLFDLCIN